MNYNYQNSPYGTKPLGEKKSMQETTKQPHIADSEEEVCACKDNDCYSNPCKSQPVMPQKMMQQQCVTPTPCNDSEDQSYQTCDSCQSPIDNCCKSDVCSYDPSKETCFCSHMNVLYSEGTTKGTSLFTTVSLAAPNYSISTSYTQPDGCCSSCVVDSTSVFKVESIKTTIKGFILSSSIPTTSILVNGFNPLQVGQIGNQYEAIIDPGVLNEFCSCNELGTKSNILLTGLNPWKYSARYELCGIVSTQGSKCKFRIVAENLATLPDSITQPLNIMMTDICMPNSKSEPILMNMEFGADGSLVNPVITAVGGPCPLPTTLTISGNLMLEVGADIRISQRKKVCFRGIVED